MKEMKKELLKLTGIHRNRKLRNFDDGSLNESINLRFKDGVWEAVGDKEVFDTLEGYNPYKIVAYHPMQEAKNIIFINIPGGRSPEVIAKTIEGSYQILFSVIPNDLYDAEVLNNILIISTKNGIRYFVYKEGQYKETNTHFPDFRVDRELAWEEYESAYSSVPLQYKALYLPTGIPAHEPDWEAKFSHFNRSNLHTASVEPYAIAKNNEDTLIEDSIYKTVSSFIELRNEALLRGCPVGDVLVCFTIELFDGTEIYHTKPIKTVFSKIFAYTNSANSGFPEDHKTHFVVSGTSKNPEPFGPKATVPPVQLSTGNYKFPFKVSGLGNIEDGVVKRVNIYISMSPMLLGADLEEEPSEMVIKSSPPLEIVGHYFVHSGLKTPVVAPTYDLSDIQDNSSKVPSGEWRNMQLYKIGEISFDDCKSGKFVDVEFKNTTSDMLATYRHLPIDNFSRHTITSKKVSIYNNRVFVLNTTTELPNVKLQYQVLKLSLEKRVKAYKTDNPPPNDRVKEGTLIITYDTIIGEYWLWGFLNKGTHGNPSLFKEFVVKTNPPSKDVYSYDLQIEIVLTTDQGDRKIMSPVRTITGQTHALRGWFSYPDARAKYITLWVRSAGDSTVQARQYKMDLLSSSLHNFSVCYIDTSAMFDRGDYVSFSRDFAPPSTDIIKEPSRVQASALNNPFVFPAKNSYNVGDSEIVGLQTINNALSEGQFGDYPMIAFTKSGIWAMQIGHGDLLVSSVVPLANEICTNPDSITAIRKGIMFVTEEGLKVLSGREVRNISEIVQGDPNNDVRAGAILRDVFSKGGYEGMISSTDFKDYIKTAKIGYDDYYEEIIVSNPTKYHSYVFSLERNSWHKTDWRFDGFSCKFPYLFGYREDKVVLMNKETRKPKKALLLTNSFGFKNTFTKFEQMTLRGKFGKSRVMVFGSTDQNSWNLLSIMTTSGGWDIRLPRGFYTCKYFVLCIDGEWKGDSYLEEIEAVVKMRYQKKIR